MTHSQTAYAASGDDSQPFLKPGWSPFNIMLMVLGFVFFWPLGLAMLAFNIWGDRLGDLKNEWKRTFLHQANWSCSKRRASPRPSGNAAFDEYRAAELERLEKERAKLEEMKAGFDAYMDSLRRARDQEEFDRFMAKRKEDG